MEWNQNFFSTDHYLSFCFYNIVNHEFSVKIFLKLFLLFVLYRFSLAFKLILNEIVGSTWEFWYKVVSNNKIV